MSYPQHVFYGKIRKICGYHLLSLGTGMQYATQINLLLNTTCPVLANSADPDQLASEEAN